MFDPSGPTAHGRFTEWSAVRVWAKPHRLILDELRTSGELAGCRRLHRRYERKAEHFLAFVGIAAALICYRRLARQ